MNIKEHLNQAVPYVYSGALRTGVTEGVSQLRSRLCQHAPLPAGSADFLVTPLGDALLRLAMGGLLALMPEDRRPELLKDVQQELLISASAGATEQVLEELGGLYDMLQARMQK